MKARFFLHLLLWLMPIICCFTAYGQAMEFKLVREQQMEISGWEQEGALNHGGIVFMGAPEYIAPGQGKFAPFYLAGPEGSKGILRLDGRDIPCEDRCVYYDPEKGILGQLKLEYFPNETMAGTFFVRKEDGSTLWQVKYNFLSETRVSEKGTVIFLCADMANSAAGAAGVYVHDLYNGKLLSAFENPKMAMDDYEFSGDGNRVIFEYELYQYPTPKDPRNNFVCIDATGKLLWNQRTERISRFSVSYTGDLILYRTVPPAELFEKKSYAQLGLMDGNGRVIWEVDNTAEAGARILPSGKHYSVALYADQARVWDPTTKQEPLSHCLFETLTHKEVRRGTSDELALLPTNEWILIDADGSNWPMDGGWRVSVYAEKGYTQKDSGPTRSLMVVNKYLTREIVYKREFTGLIVKVLASKDLKIVQLIFWDGRWMLFERVL